MSGLLLKRPLTAALVLALLAALAIAAGQGARARRSAERAEAAEATAVAAVRRAAATENAVRALERAHATTQRLEETADDAARTLARDPRGDAPIDPGLLADWRDALQRLRADAAAPRGSGPAEPARGVPAA